MKIEGQGQLLRVYVGESDRWEGRPLYEAIVRAAREQGLAGTTVLRGVEGFGANSRIHTVKVLRLSEDLPIVVEIVDQSDRIERFLPTLDKMVTEGLVTLEKVNVLIYRHQAAVAESPKADEGDLELEPPTTGSAADAPEPFSGAPDRIGRIIARAKQEAANSHHVFVDSVHVLLAMLAQRNSFIGQVLADLDIDQRAVKENLRAEVNREPPSHEYLAAVDLKSRSEANWLGHETVGPEHLLLAICETRPSAATDILMRLGVQPRDVCHSLLVLAGHGEDWQRWLADHPDM